MRTDIPLREITIEEIWQEVQSLRSELQNHNHLSSGNSQVLTGTVEGILQSPNFISGSSGWQLLPNGNIEANDGNFRGDITGASGTFSGTLSAASGTLGDITVGTNAWHIDSSGNMWWGSDSSYANSVSSNAPSISNTGLIKNVIFNNSSGNRIDLAEATNAITLYSSSDYKSQISWTDSELRLQMAQTGGYITFYSEDTEVLRADKQDGVSVQNHLPLNVMNIVLSVTSAYSTRPLDITNDGTGITTLWQCTRTTTTAQLLYGSMAGKGTGLYLELTNSANTNKGIEVLHAGTGRVAYFEAQSNASRTAPTVSIVATPMQGAHLNLNDLGGSDPSTPADGDIWFDGSDLKIKIGANTYKFDKTLV